MMAIPSIIVILIMGTSVFHLAGETLVSTLATATIDIPREWKAEKTQPVSKVVEFPILPDFTDEEALYPEIITEIPEPNTLPHFNEAPTLSKSEKAARAKIVAHIGGETEYLELEESMGAAISAAEEALSRQGISMNQLPVVAVADFTKPSYARRLTIFHPRTGTESKHLVAHGTNSGKLYAEKLSNKVGSLQSSPGLYQIGRKYRGKHGVSLRMHGLEKGLNDKAYRRAIVLHSAWYVSYKAMLKNLKKEGVPRLGCSHGCPAVHVEDLDYVLSKLTPGTYLYIYSG